MDNQSYFRFTYLFVAVAFLSVSLVSCGDYGYDNDVAPEEFVLIDQLEGTWILNSIRVNEEEILNGGAASLTFGKNNERSGTLAILLQNEQGASCALECEIAITSETTFDLSSCAIIECPFLSPGETTFEVLEISPSNIVLKGIDGDFTVIFRGKKVQ